MISVPRRSVRDRTLAFLIFFSWQLTIDAVSAHPATRIRQRAEQSKVEQRADTIEALRSRIAAHLAQPRFAPASWGVKIASLDTGRTIFEHNPEKYFNPASNAKLYTTALALERLGADYRIKTSVYSPVRPDASGTLKGDLMVYGRGDPTMTARLNGGDYFKGIEPLINQLVNAGIRRIEGDVVADESYFEGPPFGAGWEWDDLQAYYGAEVSALTINDNAIDLFVKPAERVGLPCRITTGPATSFVSLINRTQTAQKGSEQRIVVYRPVGENVIYISGRLPIDSTGFYNSVAVHDPAGWFASLFKDALSQRGITVTGRSRFIDWKYREVTPLDLSKLVEIASVESMTLSDIVRETLKPSQNLYAQLLLLQVGAGVRLSRRGNTIPLTSSQQPQSAIGKSTTRSLNDRPASDDMSSDEKTTEETGIELMNEFLSQVGVRKGDVLLEEGSGLSRRDVITPEATVALLRYMSRSKWAEIYRNALPIAGVDGTLQNRMKGTLASGNVRAKTGSLRYVYTLSGYVTSAAGEHLAFSIMLNNYYSVERAAALRDPASAAARPTPPSPRDDIDAIPIMLASFTGRSQ